MTQAQALPPATRSSGRQPRRGAMFHRDTRAPSMRPLPAIRPLDALHAMARGDPRRSDFALHLTRSPLENVVVLVRSLPDSSSAVPPREETLGTPGAEVPASCTASDNRVARGGLAGRGLGRTTRPRALAPKCAGPPGGEDPAGHREAAAPVGRCFDREALCDHSPWRAVDLARGRSGPRANRRGRTSGGRSPSRRSTPSSSPWSCARRG